MNVLKVFKPYLTHEMASFSSKRCCKINYVRSNTRKEALMASNTLHNFMIQYKNTTPQLLDAIRKVRDELQTDLNFKGKQTTIESYFNKV
ncbi:unnamed protein product [Trifolium pratense]|uniref:Uncharacterized protein n=1 Tax=Trifolium pratense TaxID=57577 RepID=A0ACB0L2N8_TRIPR|nr:unnamed protein product [Trifolium pratense]